MFDRDCLRVSESSGEKLIDRFCSVCRTNGVSVAVKRVRALRPQQYERFINSRKHGFWTSSNGATPRFRVVNNTKECMGVWLVLFEDEPVGISINWAPMPPNWLEGTEHFRLWLSKSTMVPYQPRKLKRNSASRGSPYTPVLLPPPLWAINSPPAVSSSLFGTERGWPLAEPAGFRTWPHSALISAMANSRRGSHHFSKLTRGHTRNLPPYTRGSSAVQLPRVAL